MADKTLLTVADYVQYPTVAADLRLAYGDEDEQQFGDLYLPAGTGAHPVVVLVHGGCWGAQYGLEPLGNLCRALTSEGVAVWNLEYRRLGSGGGWPTTFLDVAVGADFLRTCAANHNLDLMRVIAVGHSAGGHLATWLAARHRLAVGCELYMANPLPIHGVIALAGIPDLVAAAQQDICRGAVQQLVGGEAEIVRDRYLQASPREMVPLGVPQILINGEYDPTVPVSYVEDYARIAQAAGDQVHVDLVPEAAHFEVVTPSSHAWPAVQGALRQFFTKEA